MKNPTLILLGLAMLCVFSTTRTVFVELQPIRIVAAILFGCVIPLFTVVTLKRNDRADIFLLGSHL